MMNRTVCTGVLAAALAGAWVGSWAQGVDAGALSGKRPMTFADLMAMKRVSDPQISPSGKWVMFSVTDVSLEKNTKVNHLWVVPLALYLLTFVAVFRDRPILDTSGTSLAPSGVDVIAHASSRKMAFGAVRSMPFRSLRAN